MTQKPLVNTATGLRLVQIAAAGAPVEVTAAPMTMEQRKRAKKKSVAKGGKSFPQSFVLHKSGPASGEIAIDLVQHHLDQMRHHDMWHKSLGERCPIHERHNHPELQKLMNHHLKQSEYHEKEHRRLQSVRDKEYST